MIRNLEQNPHACFKHTTIACISNSTCKYGKNHFTSGDFVLFPSINFMTVILQKKNENREILVDYIFEKVLTLKVWEDFLVCYTRSFYSRHEKTCLQGFRPGPTQIGLYNHKWLLEA